MRFLLSMLLSIAITHGIAAEGALRVCGCVCGAYVELCPCADSDVPPASSGTEMPRTPPTPCPSTHAPGASFIAVRSTSAHKEQSADSASKDKSIGPMPLLLSAIKDYSQDELPIALRLDILGRPPLRGGAKGLNARLARLSAFRI